ncbi:MAG: hypothetical protein IK093_10415 [Ruminiclostridium sp.]|nr:hypothetical protein [Ruminiclostridium sp.]
MKDELSKEALAARIEDMCSLAQKRHQPVCSAFLNEAEQYEAQRLLSRRGDVSFAFWGGSDVCVRRILKVSESGGYDGYDPEHPDTGGFHVFPVTLTFRKADKPGHRDLLGAFMALGIKRETVGDIFIGEGAAVVFCTKTARDMITDCITTVGRIGVSVSDGLPENSEEIIKPVRYEDITVTAASVRADCIVSGITGMSREKTAEFIRAGSFMLNYAECCNISRNISGGDILTLRGYGKYVVSGEPETTKKGRIRLGLKKYL